MVSAVRPGYGGASAVGLNQISKMGYCPRKAKATRTCTSATHPLVRLPGQGTEAVVVALLLPTLRGMLELAAIWSAEEAEVSQTSRWV